MTKFFLDEEGSYSHTLGFLEELGGGISGAWKDSLASNEFWNPRQNKFCLNSDLNNVQ